MTKKWSDQNQDFIKIKVFFEASIEKIEKKKCSSILKIIEDWLKNYQSLNMADNIEEKVLEESSPLMKNPSDMKPFDIPNFCKFLRNLI